MSASRTLRLIPTSAVDGCFSCSCGPGSIFGDLNPATLEELDRMRRSSVYPAGATVFVEDEQPNAICCVGSGRVRLSRTSADGRAIVLGMATRGDVLGVRPLLLGTPHDATAEAVEATRLCFIPKGDFLAFLARNGAVSLRLAKKLSAELNQAYEQVFSVTVKSTVERLAELLLALCQTHGERVADGIALATSMGQEALAELLGVSRRSLVRALATLKGDGAIECRRRAVIVRDRGILRKSLAQGGYLPAVPQASLPERPMRQLARS